jgi:hypothetical protein
MYVAVSSLVAPPVRDAAAGAVQDNTTSTEHRCWQLVPFGAEEKFLAAAGP